MYNLVLFDLDGTLTDPGEGITNSVAYALSRFGINITDRRELYCFIGPPLVDSFMKYYGFDEEKAKQAVVYYREFFSKKGIFQNEVYQGVEEMLKELKNAKKRIALATSKPEPYAIEILKHFTLDNYFDFIGGATFDGTRSKKGDVISYVLDSMSVCDKSEVVMVGDREQDINGARQNGIDSIGVLYGYGDIDEHKSAGATYIAESVSDVTSIVFGS